MFCAPPPTLSRFLDTDELRDLAPHYEYPEARPVDFGLYDRVVECFGEGAAYALLAEQFPRNPQAPSWKERATEVPVLVRNHDQADALACALMAEDVGMRRKAWSILPYAGYCTYDQYAGMHVSPWLFLALKEMGLLDRVEAVPG